MFCLQDDDQNADLLRELLALLGTSARVSAHNATECASLRGVQHFSEVLDVLLGGCVHMLIVSFTKHNF